MNDDVDYASFAALIDDDEHSAHLLTRALLAHDAPGVQCYGDADAGELRLKAVLGDAKALRPALIVLDLKSCSDANLEFLQAMGQQICRAGIPLVVLAAPQDERRRRALIEHGAQAVFPRHGERDAYQRVAGEIVEFWAQTLRPVAVGM